MRHYSLAPRWRWALSLAVVFVAGVFVAEQVELLGPSSGWVGWVGSSGRERVHWVNQAYQDSVKVKANGRILVTGGGGNVGKHLIRHLLSSHTPVTVLDLIFHVDELAAIQHDLPQAKTLLTVLHGDIRDEKTLASALTRDVVGVVHLAAVSRVAWCLENERDCEDVNVRGTGSVLDAMEAQRSKAWFVQASSREVYGIAETFPVPEDAPLKPANLYGASKMEAETVIHRHVERRPTQVIVLRLSNVYGGPADHHERLIPAIVTNALSHRIIQIVGGDQDLDMVHVHDVVDAFSLAINRLESRRLSGGTGGTEVEIFNIGTGTSTPALEIIRKVLALTNSSSPIQTISGDVRFPDRYIGSITKARDVLGFQAKVTQDEGLHRLAGSYIAETVEYLETKLEADCSVPKEYSQADLLALDGCTGTVGVEGSEQLEYLFATPETAETSLEWGWRDEDEPQTWRFAVEEKKGEVLVRFAQETTEGVSIHFEATEKGRLFGFQTDFVAKVDRHTGYVDLAFAGSREPLIPSHMSDPAPRYRLNPHCRPGKSSPWPFFAEDPLASAISDQRLEKTRYFNASHPATMCARLEAALQLAQTKLARLGSYPLPIALEEAPLPTGSPPDWRFRQLDACTNLCDHPTICLDTGDCACAMSSCGSRVRFPFTSFANVPGLSYPPPTINWDDLAAHDPDALIKQMNSSSWLNVLRPGARRYLQKNPAFASVHLAGLPDDVQKDRDENAEDYNKLQSTWHGCFSADAVMERGVKLLSTEYSPSSLVFMPYYAGTKMMPPVEPWVDNALAHLPSNFDPANMIIPFTFDWGVCNTVLRNLFRVREWSSVPRELTRVSGWQPMGDLNSPCYRMDQDIVIPARTCLQDRLREAYGDIANVKPSRQRSTLVAFKGSLAGAGTSARQKITCEREYKNARSPRLTGGTALATYWNVMKPGADYLETIGDTVFCPVPRGTTGWATRTIDVVYAGCIPVLMGDTTHHPFWDMLDWHKLSVTIMDDEIDQLESILLGYSWNEVQRMQTNLMLIRDAFLYPAEGNMEENLKKRGPFFFAMHGTQLLRQTRFPI